MNFIRLASAGVQFLFRQKQTTFGKHLFVVDASLLRVLTDGDPVEIGILVVPHQRQKTLLGFLQKSRESINLLFDSSVVGGGPSPSDEIIALGYEHVALWNFVRSFVAQDVPLPELLTCRLHFRDHGVIPGHFKIHDFVVAEIEHQPSALCAGDHDLPLHLPLIKLIGIRLFSACKHIFQGRIRGTLDFHRFPG